MGTRIYLIRHCEAEGNVFRRCHGQYDSMVTKRGRAQTAALAKRFETEKLGAVYASDLLRARITAAPIAHSHNLELRILPDIREMSMGEWEDMPWGYLPYTHPEQAKNWDTRPWEIEIPGGETNEEVYERGLRAILQIAKENPEGTAAVVMHGVIIRVLLCRFNGWDFDRLHDIGWCDNTAVSCIEVSDGEKISVLQVNDNSHLSDANSTFANQKWWRKEDSPADFNMWFSQAGRDDGDRFDFYGREFHRCAYGTLQSYDREKFFDETMEMIQNDPRSVVFARLRG